MLKRPEEYHGLNQELSKAEVKKALLAEMRRVALSEETVQRVETMLEARITLQFNAGRVYERLVTWVWGGRSSSQGPLDVIEYWARRFGLAVHDVKLSDLQPIIQELVLSFLPETGNMYRCKVEEYHGSCCSDIAVILEWNRPRVA